MKGLMVTLLAFLMTGTVVGQQSRNSSSFDSSSFGNPNAASSTSGQQSVFDSSADQGTRSASSFDRSPDSNGNQPASDLGAVFNLPITDGLLEQFLEYGEMTAPMEPYQQRSVDQVVMQFDDGTGRKPASHKSIPVNIHPRHDAVTGTLLFEIDRSDVQTLRTQGLRYAFQPGERGRYEKVVLTLKQDRTSGSGGVSSNTTSSRSTFSDRENISGNPIGSYDSNYNSNRRDSNVLADRSVQDRNFSTTRREFETARNDDRSLPTPGVREYSDDFMGPTMGPNDSTRRNSSLASSGTGNESWRRPTSASTDGFSRDDRRLDGSGGSYDNRFGDALSTNDRNDSFASNSRQTYSTGDTYNRNQYSTSPDFDRSQFDLTDAEREALRRSSQAREDEDYRALLRDREAEQLRFEAEQDRRLAYERRLKEERYRDELRSLYESRRESLAREDAAQRRSLADEYQDDYVYRGTDYRPVIDHTAVRLPASPPSTSTMDYDRYQLDQTNYGLPPSRTTILPSATRIVPQVADNQFGIRNYAAQIPAQRVASNANVTQPVVQQPIQQTPAQRLNAAQSQLSPQELSDKIRTDKINGLMFFMLLCSLALNLYLSWIARGFYVRYNELADELRDTFTAVG